jgi:hypothetical protein
VGQGCQEIGASCVEGVAGRIGDVETALYRIIRSSIVVGRGPHLNVIAAWLVHNKLRFITTGFHLL